jgi:hypothetical protein
MTTSTTQFWGRSWKLTVQYPSGSGTATKEVVSQNYWEPEALRVTFDVVKSTLPSPFWFADISIYNLNDPEIQNFLFNASWVTLEAGYQTGPNKSSIIWDGPVLQVLFDRVEVVDFKITLHCLASIPLINENIVNFAQGPFASQLQLVSRMVSKIGANYNASPKAQTLLSAKQYPRGKTVFGKVSKYLFDMADDNFLAHWMDGSKINISEMDSGASVPDLVYSPPDPPGYKAAQTNSSITKSVIGVPRQTPFGVIFTVLLDPRLIVKAPPLLVQLDRTVISQSKIVYGSIQTPLDADLVFVAAQIHHYGDTRGNDWHTEVTGYTRTYAQGLSQGMFLPNAQR